VIGTVLGQLPETTFVGELSQVWRAFTTEGWQCSCGEPLASCSFWVTVREKSGIDADDVDELRTITEGLRVRPASLARLLGPSIGAAQAKYATALARVYKAISTAAKSTLIIDSSKSAPELLLTARTLALDLSVLHVVRDPRAIAHSRSRRIPANKPGSQWMASEGPITSSIRWTTRNLLIELACSRYAEKRNRMRYEDFVAEPSERIRALALGRETCGVVEQLREGRLTVGVRHALDGNTRVLRNVSTLEIRADDEWRSKMPPSRRLAATMPAVPLLWMYRYGSI